MSKWASWSEYLEFTDIKIIELGALKKFDISTPWRGDFMGIFS